MDGTSFSVAVISFGINGVKMVKMPMPDRSFDHLACLRGEQHRQSVSGPEAEFLRSSFASRNGPSAIRAGPFSGEKRRVCADNMNFSKIPPEWIASLRGKNEDDMMVEFLDLPGAGTDVMKII